MTGAVIREGMRVRISNSSLNCYNRHGTIVITGAFYSTVALDGDDHAIRFSNTSLQWLGNWAGLPQPEPAAAQGAGCGAAPITKPTNPKDAAALAKCPLHLLSPQAKAHWAIAQQIGALKYGSWNWTVAGVSASVYVSAIQRHTDRWFAGQEYDPDGQHNLGAVMACAAILLDAQHRGMLTDDRPLPVDMTKLYAELETISKEMIKATAGYTPQHCYAKVVTTLKTN